jgi:hypothetical protein
MRKLIAALCLALVAGGCGESVFETRTDYFIGVEDVIVPEEISMGEALRVQFVGEIGPTTCHRFLDILTNASPTQLEIVLVGRYEASQRVQCRTMPQLLTEEHDYVHESAMTDPFRVIFIQPSGEQVERTVRVR